MLFLITMNMPSAQGYSVHQLTIECEVQDIKSFNAMLNENEFVMGKQFYRRRSPRGDVIWEDRGLMIINTSHIGKVQEFVEFDNFEPDFNKPVDVAPAFEKMKPPRVKRF